MLIRIMHDRGFNFFNLNTYCENLFVRHFDPKDGACKENMLPTAFELLEPFQQLEKMIGFSGSRSFSTELMPTKNRSVLA